MASFFKNPFAPDPVTEQQAFSLDPVLAEQITSRLPAIQRARRRALRLRAGQKAYAEDAAKEREVGHVQQGDSSGGLFPIAHEYIPNYGGMVEKVASGLGSYLEGKQATRAEENYEALTNPEIIRATQQLGQTDSTTPGQPAAAAPAATQSPAEEAPPDNQTYNALQQILGLPQDQADQLGAYNPTTVALDFDLSNKQPDPNAMAQVNMEGMTPQQNQQLTSAKAFMAAAGIPEEDQAAYLNSMATNKSGDLPQGQTAGSLDQLQGTTTTPLSDTGTDQPNAPGMPTPLMDPNAPQQAMGAMETAPTQDAAAVSAPPSLPGSATPAAPAAPTPDATAAAPQGAVPGGPKQLPSVATDQSLRAYLGLMGMDAKDIAGGRRLVSTRETDDGKIYKYFSDGSEEVSEGRAKATSRLFRDPGTGQINRVYMSGDKQGQSELVTNSDGSPLTMTTDQANAANIETSKVIAHETAAAQMAPTSAATAAEIKGAEQAAEINTKARGEAADTLRQMKSFEPLIDTSFEGLKNDPAINSILGNKMWALVDEKHPAISTVARFFTAGTPQARAAARILQMKEQVFLPAFRSLKGGGQITDFEGNKAEAALARMDQAMTPADFNAAAEEFIKWYKAGMVQLERASQGAYDIRGAGASGRSSVIAPAQWSRTNLPEGASIVSH